ncbi:CARDB domain-containing protein [Paenibacillus roseipurpureus]|uniref:Probable pectate lyase C n=1 Tax=Paenibacillus roseopurpureus TaxID=2918901 RepID=A0AA96LTD6_9BACL|nr:CARDB domain-containing protein [Paenibacillus sp. MBLB1832]WNR46166.1 CARDB domain-containing protein [Paenibacillus sp. MBLB1832]
MLTSCLFVFLTASTSYGAGNVYYVDDINGNNNNEGTSEQTAWKTLAKVNGTTFQPGDHILFKAGGSWSGQLHPLGSGTDTSPIVIDQYGTGNKPIINGGGILNSGAVLLYNQQYWEINNLEITNKGTASGQKMGVSIEAKDVGILNHIYLKNLVIHDVNGLQTDKQNGGIWVHTYGNLIQTKFNDIQIMNNTVYDTDRAGIVVTSDWWCNPDLVTCGTTRPAYYPSTNVVVSNNYVYSVGGDGISIRDTTSPVVEYNVVHDANARSGDYNNAIWTYNATNAKIQYNEAYLTRTTKDGYGLGVDYLQDGANLQYNYTHDNEGGAVGIYSDGTWAPQSNRNFKIRYNISQNDGAAIYSFYGPAVNGEIYNNTVYVKGDSSPALYKFNNWGGYASNISSKNNIFYNLGIGNYVWGQSSNITFDHNLFYGAHPASEPADANKITSDPLLVNPGSGGSGIHSVDGYKLLNGSPALATGTLIANHGGQDYWGNSVSTTLAPNIGAYNGVGQSLSGIDLQVSAVKVQESSFIPGDSIHFQLTVRNNGTTATGSQTITNQFMVDGQTVKSEPYLINLSPGQSITVTSSAWNTTKSGFLLKAVADASNVIAEVQEDNNMMSQYINLVVGKDIVPVSLGVQESNWGVGSTIHFTLTVKNQGNVPIVNEWFGARFYLDGATTEVDWSGTPDAGYTLNPGGTITLVSKKGWKVDRAQFSLMGDGDTWNQVVEVNEANNKMTVQLPLSSEKSITSFAIGNQQGTVTAATYQIGVKVPYGTDITSLTPVISVSNKATVTPGNGAAQNFTNPVIYTVTGENGTTQQWTVTVTQDTAYTLTGPSAVVTGDSFQLTYGLANVTESVYAKSVTVHYDPAKLEYINVESLLNGFNVIASTTTPGSIRIIEASTGSTSPLTGTLNLLSLTFRAIDRTVSTNVYMTDIVLGDQFGSVKIVNGGNALGINIIEFIPVDKSELSAALTETASAIAAAKELNPLAPHFGYYPKNKIDALKAAYANANGVFNQVGVTQSQLDVAKNTLTQALSVFLASANQSAGIGDLALLAANYHATSNNPNWPVIRMYDFDQNGKLDLYDLVTMAQRILN